MAILVDQKRTIDEAAALAMAVEAYVVAGWRRRLAAEPTITNERAQGFGEGAG